MKLTPASLGHLTYCTNIHSGEAWSDIFAGLQRHLPEIKALVSLDAPLGVGLRLSALAAETLCQEGEFESFSAFLAEGDYYVFTLNGFPYGTFHGQPVKQGAYRPDWTQPERLAYTNTLADHLIRWLPEGIEGSISTVPGTYKDWAAGADRETVLSSIRENIVRHVAHLWQLHTRTGRLINLALEPEPFCLIETIKETVDFFHAHLHSRQAAAQLAQLTGLDEQAAVAALRRHIGVCYDVCHAAVEYEDPQQSLADLASAGIKISKLQLSSAMRIASVTPEARNQIAALDEPIYMHQVIERRSNALARFADIPLALENAVGGADAEWRVHFHVPIFLEEMQGVGTTQKFLKDVLRLHADSPVTDQLEIETYTWDVLPDRYTIGGMSAAIAREINWVREQLHQ